MYKNQGRRKSISQSFSLSAKGMNWLKMTAEKAKRSASSTLDNILCSLADAEERTGHEEKK